MMRHGTAVSPNHQNHSERRHQRGSPTDEEYDSSLPIGFFFREAKSGVFFRFGRLVKLFCGCCFGCRRPGPEPAEFLVGDEELPVVDCNPECGVAVNRW